MKNPLTFLQAVLRWERPHRPPQPDTREPEITLLTAEQRNIGETLDRLRAQSQVPQEGRQSWN